MYCYDAPDSRQGAVVHDKVGKNVQPGSHDDGPAKGLADRLLVPQGGLK